MRQYDLSYVTTGKVTTFTAHNAQGQSAMWIFDDYVDQNVGQIATADLILVLKIIKRSGFTARKSVKLNP